MCEACVCWRHKPELRLAVSSLAVKGKANRLFLPFSLIEFTFAVQSFHLLSMTREASVVCLLKHAYFSLWFCWFYPDSACVFGGFFCPSVSPFVFSISRLDKEGWYPPLKEIAFNDKKEGIRQKMTSKTAHNLSESQGALTTQEFSSRKHRNQRALGQWARGKLWNTLSLLWQQRMTVCSTCVWVFIHHFPWKVSCSRVGGGWFWVGCG